MIDGWINLNKPKGFSSAYCLNVIKSKFKKIKIGHAGTLDPLAEGVLPIALGEATKTVSLIHLLFKSYLFEIQWGSETDTLDLEGKVINSNEIYPEKKEVQNILKKFIGYQMQMPPKFSAVKINGKRSYELARNNLEFDMEERKVFIKNIRLLKHENSKSLFYIKCGTGTYIRSLARDIAKFFGGFAHVTKLVRTRYGNFRIKNSNSLEKLIEKESTANFLKYVLDIQSALIHIPSIKLNDERINLIKNGMKVSLVNEFGKVSLDNIYTAALEKPLALGYLKSGFFIQGEYLIKIMTKKILNKESVFKDLKLHAKDVGSSEVQIAILTERIRYLTEHFTKNKKDKHSYTGLTTLVNRRKKLLDYLSKTNATNYKKILEKLNIRK